MTSGLTPEADIVIAGRHVSKVPNPEVAKLIRSRRRRGQGVPDVFLARFRFECARAQPPFGRSDGVAGGHPDDEGDYRHHRPARHLRARSHHSSTRTGMPARTGLR